MKKNDMQKKKLLFMIDTLGGGGAERVLLHILRDIDRTKFEVDLFLMIKDGVYIKDIPADISYSWIFNTTDSIRFLPFKYLYRLYRRTMLDLFKIFPLLLSRMSNIKKHYDIGISFCEGHNTPLLSLKANYFRKKIAWIHIDLRTHKSMIRREDLRKLTPKFDRIYFVSEGAKEGFLALFPEQKENPALDVVFNPIDYQAIVQEAEQEQPIKTNKPTVIAIGRLTAQKRYDKLLNVHKRLIDKGIDHEVWILGTGEDEKKLKAQAEKLGITQSCLFLGFQNPYPYLNSADVFVMTSDYEGLPVAVCEAMVLAKPIVSTKITGPVELLEDGRYGLLVDNTEEAIEKGLEEMLQNRELRTGFSKRLETNRGNFIFSTDIKDIEKKFLTI